MATTMHEKEEVDNMYDSLEETWHRTKGTYTYNERLGCCGGRRNGEKIIGKYGFEREIVEDKS